MDLLTENNIFFKELNQYVTKNFSPIIELELSGEYRQLVSVIKSVNKPINPNNVNEVLSFDTTSFHNNLIQKNRKIK